MRIMLCANGRSPHAVRWANGLADRGHEVAFVGAPEDLAAGETSAFRPSISQHDDLSSAALAIPWQTLRQRSRARALAQHLQPELVHGFYLSSNGLVAHATGERPLVLSAFGSDVANLLRDHSGSVRDRLADAYLVRRTRDAVASADVVLADSTALALAVRQRSPATPTRIIRFGVEVDSLPGPMARSKWRGRLGIDEDALVLLSSRVLRPLYNIDVIIRALALIRERLPNTILVLKEFASLSDEEYRRRCLDLVDELDLRDGVRLVGELDREELLELHTTADVYISVPATDGTSVSVLEAMAAGVAVVASDVPGIDPLILHDNVTSSLVSAGDVGALASAVIALGVDPRRRQVLAEEARAVVRVHGDFDRELDRAVLLYQELARTST